MTVMLPAPMPGTARLIIAVVASLPCLAFAASPPADVVVRHAEILTVDAGFHRAAAVAMKDGVFVAVGSEAEISPWIGAATKVIDAGGAMVIPGLLESHVHATTAAK